MIFDLDSLTIALGDLLAGHPQILIPATQAWFLLLVASPLLLLLTGRARTVLALLFVAGQVGIGLTVDVGLFPLIVIVAMLPFFDGSVWDWVERRLDGVRHAVATERSARRLPVLRVFHSQATGSRRATKSEGTDRADPLESAVRPWGRRAGGAIVAAALVAALGWNGVTLGLIELPNETDLPVDHTEWRWDMFAPAPPGTDGWYVFVGTRESGDRVDPFRGGTPTWDRPPDTARTYPSNRWRKYLNNLRWERPELHAELAEYLCSRWNRSHDTNLITVRIVFVAEETNLTGPDPITRRDLGRYPC